jgi:hypothetical protein
MNAACSVSKSAARKKHRGKKKRDAGGDSDRAAGSTILSLLEAAEEHWAMKPFGIFDKLRVET